MLKSRFLVNLVVSDSPQRPYQIQRMVLPMKIKVSQLGNRVHEVKTSNRNMEKMYDLQLLMAQADDIQDKTPIEIINMQRGMLHDSIDFLITVLGLNKQEKDNLGGLEFAETIQAVNYVFERMMGMSDEDIDLANKKEQAADKSDKD
jgi:ribosomal protein L14E/L6E/L27E